MVRARYQAQQHASRVHAQEFISAAASPPRSRQRSQRDRPVQAAWYSRPQEHQDRGRDYGGRQEEMDTTLHPLHRFDVLVGPPVRHDREPDGRGHVPYGMHAQQQRPNQKHYSMGREQRDSGGLNISKHGRGIPPVGVNRDRAATMPAWAAKRQNQSCKERRR